MYLVDLFASPNPASNLRDKSVDTLSIFSASGNQESYRPNFGDNFTRFIMWFHKTPFRFLLGISTVPIG